MYNMCPDFKYSNTYSKLRPVVPGYKRENLSFLSGPTILTYTAKHNEYYKMVHILLTPLPGSGKFKLSLSFGSNISNLIATSLNSSSMMGKGKSSAARFLYACMSLIQLSSESTGSQDRMTHLTLRLVNSGTSDTSVPSSVAHTGEKADGCEIRMPHL